MLFFKDSSEKPIQVFFITEPHLKMLKAYAIPFSDLPTLLYYNLSHDDLLSWITWQRAVETKLFSRAMTTYDMSTDKPAFDLDRILASKLTTCYQLPRLALVQYYEQHKQTSHYAFHIDNDTITLLAVSDPNALPDGFHPGDAHPARALYAALLYKLGHHGLYFKNTTNIPYSAVQGITLKNLIPHILRNTPVASR